MNEDIPIYEDGRHYDEMVHFEDDVDFYKECVDEYGGPVLELACGTGRVTIPIAEDGVDTVGLDISHHRLELAREKASKKDVDVDFVEDDMRDFEFDKKFGTIILPANSMQALTELEDHEKLFSSVRKHLKDDGRFIFQIFNPDLNILTRDPDEESMRQNTMILTVKVRYT